jgi:hypothetical protein
MRNRWDGTTPHLDPFQRTNVVNFKVLASQQKAPFILLHRGVTLSLRNFMSPSTHFSGIWNGHMAENSAGLHSQFPRCHIGRGVTFILILSPWSCALFYLERHTRETWIFRYCYVARQIKFKCWAWTPERQKLVLSCQRLRRSPFSKQH